MGETETTSPKPKKEAYARDIFKLIAGREKFLRESAKFYGFEATPSEIVKCFYMQDPLDKVPAIIHTSPQSFDKTISEIKLAKIEQTIAVRHVIGAALILNGVLDPDYLKTWETSFKKNINGESDTCIDDETAMKHALEISAKGDKNLSLEELRQLAVAGSMLILASGKMLSKEESMKHPRYIRDLMREFGVELRPQEFRKRLIYYSNLVLNEVYRHGIASDDPRKRLVGLKAGWETSGDVFATLTASFRTKEIKNVQDTRKKLILKMVEDLESVFLSDNGILYQKDFIKNSRSLVKGSLHELIWFLDFLILSEITKDNQKIYTSLFFEDRPGDVKTEFYRGFDFAVSSDKKRYLIQVKSNSGKNQKNYDEIIELLEEENFMDIEPRRLWAKLNYYKQLIACGFNTDLAPNPQKYILPTVYEAKERIKINGASMLQKVEDQFDLSFFSDPNSIIIKPNRQTRRHMARQAKKRNGRN